MPWISEVVLTASFGMNRIRNRAIALEITAVKAQAVVAPLRTIKSLLSSNMMEVSTRGSALRVNIVPYAAPESKVDGVRRAEKRAMEEPLKASFCSSEMVDCAPPRLLKAWFSSETAESAPPRLLKALSEIKSRVLSGIFWKLDNGRLFPLTVVKA